MLPFIWIALTAALAGSLIGLNGSLYLGLCIVGVVSLISWIVFGAEAFESGFDPLKK